MICEHTSNHAQNGSIVDTPIVRAGLSLSSAAFGTSAKPEALIGGGRQSEAYYFSSFHYTSLAAMELLDMLAIYVTSLSLIRLSQG